MNAPSLRLYTCMWSNSWKIYCQNKPQTNSLTALSHSLLVRHQGVHCPCHLHPQNQSQEKAHEAYPYGKSSLVYLFHDVWLWQCHLSRSNHEWDLLLSAVVGNWFIHGCQILICKKYIFHEIVFTVVYTAKFFLVK